MTLGEESYTRHKNRVKRARTLVEIAFVVAALYLLYTLFFHGKTYQPYTESQVSPTTDTGFIALSYFGVDRIGDTSTLIGEKQLQRCSQHFRAAGHVYPNGIHVPDHEAGRSDL